MGARTEASTVRGVRGVSGVRGATDQGEGVLYEGADGGVAVLDVRVNGRCQCATLLACSHATSHRSSHKRHQPIQFKTTASATLEKLQSIILTAQMEESTHNQPHNQYQIIVSTFFLFGL